MFSNEQGDRDGIYGIAKVQINGPDDLWSEDGALMLLVPARRKSDGCLGMYDKNNDIFYPCITSGTGYFTITDVNGNVIASELRRLEYIHFDGNDYINTGFTPWSGMAFEITKAYDSDCGTYEVDGHGNINANNRAFIGIQQAKEIFAGLGAQSPTVSNAPSIYDKHIYGIKLSSGSTNNWFKIDGTNYLTNIACNYQETGRQTMIIGGCYRSSGVGFLCHEKVYEARFYNADALTWTLVPVQRKSDGTIGLLKLKANGATPDFMTSANGLLEAGPVIDEYWNLQA